MQTLTFRMEVSQAFPHSTQIKMIGADLKDSNNHVFENRLLRCICRKLSMTTTTSGRHGVLYS
eukprot:m.180098 g.180098  ORF g.180098 m.180098 type:complete len:63 (-) comp32004_c0_seq2:117-305(-)